MARMRPWATAEGDSLGVVMRTAWRNMVLLVWGDEDVGLVGSEYKAVGIFRNALVRSWKRKWRWDAAGQKKAGTDTVKNMSKPHRWKIALD